MGSGHSFKRFYGQTVFNKFYRMPTYHIFCCSSSCEFRSELTTGSELNLTLDAICSAKQHKITKLELVICFASCIHVPQKATVRHCNDSELTKQCKLTDNAVVAIMLAFARQLHLLCFPLFFPGQLQKFPASLDRQANRCLRPESEKFRHLSMKLLQLAEN